MERALPGIKVINKAGNSIKVFMRKFPYPFRAMLALSSDIDGASPGIVREYLRYLRTFKMTKNNRGIGLDFADSFWMYNVNYQHSMSYWEGDNWTKESSAEEIRRYIQAGWIDTIHSYGDFSRQDLFRRQYAVKAIEEWIKQEIRLKVWVDHGGLTNDQNLGGRHFDYWFGDDPEHVGYHADIIFKYGIEFMWDTMAKPCVFGHDSIIEVGTLRDRQKVWLFYRYCNNWLPGELHLQLTKEHLDSIVAAGQYTIVANHFGCFNELLPLEARRSLELLKRYQDENKILVSRKSRLLEYNRNHEYLVWEAKVQDSKIVIDIKEVNDIIFGAFVPMLDQVRGITFYVEAPNNVQLLIDGQPVPSSEIQINPCDGLMSSIGIKWFEPDYTDYGINI